MDKLSVRAITAYYRSLGAGVESVALDATQQTADGHAYVVLKAREGGQCLAVYRCMNRGELKRLKRWPSVLTEPAAPAPHAGTAAPVSPTLLLDLVPLPRKNTNSPPDDADSGQPGLF